MKRALSIAALLLICACHGFGGSHGRLSKEEAAILAVDLANEECMKLYSMAPFTRSSSALEYIEGRWRWGVLDLAGVAGYSCSVSFDATGGRRQVQIYFSTDRITPKR